MKPVTIISVFVLACVAGCGSDVVPASDVVLAPDVAPASDVAPAPDVVPAPDNGPAVTQQIRSACWWVDDPFLQDALDAIALDRDRGVDEQEALSAFTATCVTTCVQGGGNQATCTSDCEDCSAALVAEVWGS